MRRISTLALTAALLASPLPALAQVENPLADARVRQAIAYAIDMDTITETLFRGTATPADSMIPNGAYKVEGLNAYAYDPDKARALLKEAGWVDGTELEVVYYYGDQDTVDLMTAIQAYLADVGVGMSFRKLEGDVTGQLNVPPSADFQTSGVTWDMAYGARAALALQEYYNVYQAQNTAYTPPTDEREALIAGINGSADPEVLRKAFYEFEKYENEMLSDIPLYYQQLFIYESDRLDRHGAENGNEQFVYENNLINWTVTPNDKGEEVLYLTGGPVQFFEQLWLNPGGQISKLLFDRLLKVDGSLFPIGTEQAESYSVSEDGLTVEFVLKDGLTWHDGEPFTVDDVAWSIETALKVPSLNSVFSNTFHSIVGAQDYLDAKTDHVAGIAAEGNTITLTLSSLDPNVLTTFGQFPVMPEHLMADVNPLEFQQHPFWQNPVGTGPYRIEEVQMNDFARFVPFEGYHGGVAKIPEVVAFPGGGSVDNENVPVNAAAGRLDYGATRLLSNVEGLRDIDHMNLYPVDIAYTRSFRVNAFPFKPE